MYINKGIENNTSTIYYLPHLVWHVLGLCTHVKPGLQSTFAQVILQAINDQHNIL